ncbi:Flagellar biosynthesis protein FlhA [Zhongshania aliphaticivorans]|uniref:Flagellar biosynthesis protein FlhA n=1 Tax=Zhongshania aliphaticivorans TaxID=1470434 RepID=A0A5S9NL63_9GAMM|nr:flagellar biosynthesis protein FlhA [Zhongshania aliphaticivorans]CAA0090661.1 Flagellar biosynthesis protein FlhA [Zhongshania aliphaticivorans]CAA0098157.1 Flagellar biosynthesis protein FlhA [Zhongshania aliphaticivorans]
MATQTMAMPAWMQKTADSGIGVLLLLVACLGMLVIPMPPFLLDLLFTFNITLSLVIILAVIYVDRPIDFSVFPTVLLLATLLRLALNVASTRVVLLEGHSGPGAAGKVIESFGEFVIGGNYVVGIVVFIILVVINFVVVTKGAGRVSEVTARFTLDAMPGKQMAIDSDLNAGLLNQEEASRRREEVRTEADFYGSMDGASKFVRGDAVAGIMILFINVIGGLGVGMAQHGLTFAQAMHNYTLLTIGDGLVAQLPSLLLSTAVAIIVTRISRSQNMGKQIVGQMFANPNVLYMAATLLGLIGIIPGMPNLVFLMLAAACGGSGWWMQNQKKNMPELLDEDEKLEELPAAREPSELNWDEVTPMDVVSLEVGYRLIPLVDRNQGGELIARITGVRKKLSKDLGFLVQPVHIRDNLELSPSSYRIQLLGDTIAQGEIQAGKELAINPGGAQGALRGAVTKDPAFGMEAVWIDSSQRDQAQTMGYTVVDPCTVIATHLSQIIKQHAHELLGHEEVQQLLDRLAKTDPRLVENVVPKQLPLSVVVRVLQSLLKEGVSIRSIRMIAESLAEQAPRSKNPDELLEGVRVALGRMIVQEINGLEEDLPVSALDPDLEQLLQDMLRGNAGAAGLEPGIAERLQNDLAEYSQSQELAGQPAVVLVSPSIRSWVSRFTRRSVPGLAVLSYNEVPDSKQVRLLTTIGQQGRLN